MRRSRLSSVLVAALALGCSGSLTAPSAGQLAGTWSLRSIRPAGQTERPTPSGATYTLTLEEGRLSTRADCNVCNGAFALSGDTLSAGSTLACTRAACPTATFEHLYTGLLAGEHTVLLLKRTLVMSSPRGALRFDRESWGERSGRGLR